MIYLDNNGTTFLLDEVKDHVRALLDTAIGNSASNTISGRIASDLLWTARQHVAELIDAPPEHIMFTSSGSESNVAAVRSALKGSSRRAIVSSEIEHASLRELWQRLAGEGYELRFARTLPAGSVDLDHLLTLVDENVAVVCLQAVNNETGVIQPVREVCERAHYVGALTVVDGAQAIGKMPFSVSEFGSDFVAFTGHKFHAPAGVGALYSRSKWNTFTPLITGGSQEFGARGGTHNLYGISAMGEAARLRKISLLEAISYMRQLRELFEARILQAVPYARVNGTSERVCNTANLRFERIDGKALLAQLQSADIECSQSSACTAAYPEPSHVLRMMGLSYDQAFSSIRFSFSVQSTRTETLEAARVVAECAQRIERVLGGVGS